MYLVDATLPFRLVWLGDFFSESATLLFFVAVGYKFGYAVPIPSLTIAVLLIMMPSIHASMKKKPTPSRWSGTLNIVVIKPFVLTT